jgi:hypothetical protein
MSLEMFMILGGLSATVFQNRFQRSVAHFEVDSAIHYRISAINLTDLPTVAISISAANKSAMLATRLGHYVTKRKLRNTLFFHRMSKILKGRDRGFSRGSIREEIICAVFALI